MKLAIVIGVSNYSSSANNLPGCKNDAEAVGEILKKTNNYDDILYINNNEKSAETKTQISNFVSKHKGDSIEELFYYYSGHGEFVNDEFYYVLSDFDTKKRNQTSLQNSEIDDLIRTLSPELVVKLIDACQSGTTYIKEGNVLNKYFNDTKVGFKKCYFLNSSLNNQSSFQNDHISFFTLSFIKALKEHTTQDIRYKDIIDVISDDFIDNQDQTPFFVIQADYTEKFCTYSDALREYLNRVDTVFKQQESQKSPSTLLEMVKENAKDYINKEGADKVVEFLKNEFASFSFSEELKDLYKLNISFQKDYKSIPRLGVIATWLRQNKNEHFAKPIYEDEYDDEVGGVVEVITGFDLKFLTPFKSVKIDIIGLFPNLTSYQLCAVFLMSKKTLTLFYCVINYLDEGWDSRKLNKQDVNWIFTQAKVVDDNAVKLSIESIKKHIEDRIVEELKSKFESQIPKE